VTIFYDWPHYLSLFPLVYNLEIRNCLLPKLLILWAKY
jgi:hypothetical protein